MKLYHSKPLLFIFILVLLLAGCDAPVVTQSEIVVRLSVDGNTGQVTMPAGSTVQDVLTAADVVLEAFDRVDPPFYTVLKDESQVQVIRVTEEFVVEEEVIPFTRQFIRNESLPEGDTRLVQPGVNGLRETTIRRVYEEGVQVAQYEVKTVILQEPVSEIEMIGSQNTFTPLTIPGRLFYLSSGNAWMMEGSTANRVPIITTGDLDGRVFRISPDGAWILYTRNLPNDETNINSLWAMNLEDPSLILDLNARNVIHFADWVPGIRQRVAYSTVEPRDAPPGWQANNDLNFIDFSLSGWVSPPEVAVETNFGGIYGWWGTTYTWARDGSRLLFFRPDGVGLVILERNLGERLEKLVDIVPFQTQSDWAWVPGTSWAAPENVIYTVDHGESADVPSPEASPVFDLIAIPLAGGNVVRLVEDVGMFAYPAPSPVRVLATGEQQYLLAYLQAIFPVQSDTSRYRLMVMDRDGSNRTQLFPEEGAPGIDPQRVVWSPAPLDSSQAHWIAVLNQGNLWMIHSVNGEARQVTGDGLIDRLEWQ